jgi:Family of unknown function (DUF6523)
MTNPTGFGKKVHKEKKVTDGAKKRSQASDRYESFKSSGSPEYEIYMRVKNQKQWFPVGAIAVKRSNQVNAAIFANEEELCKGGFRIFPVLKRNQGNLEYGYRLKEFKDEPIQLAERPAVKVPNVLQQAAAKVGDLFKRK